MFKPLIKQFINVRTIDFTNTLDKWLDEGAEDLKTKADKAWESKMFK